MMCLSTLTMQAQTNNDYIDIGLPSGTKWKSTNESGYFDYNRANSTFAGKIPEKWQWQELISKCDWIWTNGGYKVVGDNGNSIFFPENGFIDGVGNLSWTDCGYYWTSTFSHYDHSTADSYAWRFAFSWNDLDWDTYPTNCSFSVRLVKH